MSTNPSKPEEKKVGFLVYPFGVHEMCTSEQILTLLERLHYLGYAIIISPINLKTTGWFTFDLQISYALIKKADVMILVEEEHMTQTMLRELLKGREYDKPVVRIPRKVD